MTTISSSFRIDRRAIRAPEEDGAGVVVLPGLPEHLLPKKAGTEEPQPDEAAADPEQAAALRELEEQRQQQENELEAKKRELEDLQKQAEETRQQIQVMLQQAEIDANKLRDQAKQEGYQSGIEDAKQEFKEVLATEQREFRRSVETLARARDEINAQIEDSVLDLSLYIAERILHESLREDDQRFMNVVRSTIEQVKDQEGVILRLNRKEYDRFFKDDKDEFAELLESSGIQVKQDMNVESGEFVIESEFGTLRSGIQTQLERMRSQLTSSE
ncbi:MAG: hypothetical protein HDQ87_02480 [Clostridia bacterium]|nr:hypothetical protein [Clostridia bacterium]